MVCIDGYFLNLSLNILQKLSDSQQFVVTGVADMLCLALSGYEQKIFNVCESQNFDEGLEKVDTKMKQSQE